MKLLKYYDTSRLYCHSNIICLSDDFKDIALRSVYLVSAITLFLLHKSIRICNIICKFLTLLAISIITLPKNTEPMGACHHKHRLFNKRITSELQSCLKTNSVQLSQDVNIYSELVYIHRLVVSSRQIELIHPAYSISNSKR